MSPKLLRDRSALCPSPALGTPSTAATQWPAKSTAPTIWSYLLRYRAQPEEERKEEVSTFVTTGDGSRAGPCMPP